MDAWPPKRRCFMNWTMYFFALILLDMSHVVAWCFSPLLSQQSPETKVRRAGRSPNSNDRSHHFCYWQEKHCLVALTSSPWGREEWDSNNTNNNENTDRNTENNRPTSLSSLSVGDYVKGVHGGKYQFSAAGLNTAGQEFAETGYGGASQAVVYDNASKENDSMPRWAMRLGVTLKRDELERLASRHEPVTLGPETTTTQVVVVQNQERTWEPFYVKILRVVVQDDTVEEADGTTTTCCFRATPTRGKLAPAGGAPDPYNPTQPFSDAARIELTLNNMDVSSSSTPPVVDYYMVIGTEEEQWYYRLVVV